jgi:hypothetical protein
MMQQLKFEKKINVHHMSTYNNLTYNRKASLQTFIH